MCSVGEAAASDARLRLHGLQISCRRSCPRPHQSTLPLDGLSEPGACTEGWPAPACRLLLVDGEPTLETEFVGTQTVVLS